MLQKKLGVILDFDMLARNKSIMFALQSLESLDDTVGSKQNQPQYEHSDDYLSDFNSTFFLFLFHNVANSTAEHLHYFLT